MNENPYVTGREHRWVLSGPRLFELKSGRSVFQTGCVRCGRDFVIGPWHWRIRTPACCGRCSRAMRITALRPPPKGAPGRNLAEGVTKVVCQVDGEPGRTPSAIESFSFCNSTTDGRNTPCAACECKSVDGRNRIKRCSAHCSRIGSGTVRDLSVSLKGGAGKRKTAGPA
jgi:hypothetical protein